MITLEDAKTHVGKGWHKLLDELYEKLPPGHEVLQVKEKFGGLRFYVDGEDREYTDLIFDLENRSFTFCEDCGTQDNVRTAGSWIKTLCGTCRKNRR